jgi:Putative zinc-finger
MSRCEKYADWLSDAALGELAPSRESKLLAHATECGACREAYQRAHDLAEFVDRGVESLVAGEPSLYFATRLRTRMVEEHTHSLFAWLGSKPVAASLLVAAVAAVVVVSRGPQRHNPEPLAVSLEAGSSSNPTTNQPQVRRGHSISGSREATTAPPNLRRRHVARNVGSSRQPEVLVPPGEIDAILQFAKAVRSGQIDGKQLLAAQQDTEKPLEITPIEIAPLISPQPDVSSDAPDDGRP